MKEQKSKSISVAQTLQLKELTGWLGKRLHVPVGKKGIVMDAKGNYKLYDPGTAQILNPLARINGKGIGMRVGIFPAEVFDLGARYENVLTGDDQLVDLNLILYLKVIKADLFFLKVIEPVGKVTELPDFGQESIRAQIEKVVQQYAREDIIRNLPSEKIINEISKEIMPIFPSLGLQLVEIPILIFRRSEDRLVIEDKLVELESQLMEKQAVMDNSNENAQPDLEEVADQVLPEAVRIRSKTGRTFPEIMDNIQRFKLFQNAPKKHWILQALQGPNMANLDEETEHTVRRWRSLKIRWMGFLLGIGLLITYLFYSYGVDFSSEKIVGFLVGVWGSIFSLLIATLKKLVEQQESIIINSSAWVDFDNAQFVSRDDRIEVDRLVRKQCSEEIQSAIEIANQLRAMVFRSGNSELAMQLKELEKALERQKNNTLSSNYGMPFYLSEFPVDDAEWHQIMDREEQIIELSKKLNNAMGVLRMQMPDVDASGIQQVEKQLYGLDHLFKSRSRIN